MATSGHGETPRMSETQGRLWLSIRKISSSAGYRMGKGEHCHRNLGGIGETFFILKSPTDVRH